MPISIPLNATLQYSSPSSSSSSSSLVPSSPLFSPIPSTTVSLTGIRQRCLRMVTSCVSNAQKSVLNGATDSVSVVGREQIRLGLPSKGRMAADSLDLLKVSVLGSGCVSLTKLRIVLTNFHGDLEFFLYLSCRNLNLFWELLLTMLAIFGTGVSFNSQFITGDNRRLLGYKISLEKI